jgi:hypothetical protein
MSWNGNFSGHTDSKEQEQRIVEALRSAAEEIADIVGDNGFSSSYSSTHHGSGGLRPPRVETQDEPAPGTGTGGAAPGGPSLGSGNAAPGGEPGTGGGTGGG